MLTEIGRFVNHMRRRNPRARTWRDYTYDLTCFADHIGDRPLDSVTLTDIDQFVITLCERGLQPTTINRRLAAIMSFYTFLSDEQPDLVCPVIPRRHNLRERQRLPRPVPLEEIDRFFAAITTDRDRAMFTLMLRCGLRISEVAQLTLTDLYLAEQPPRMVVDGKGSRERSVYLSPQAEIALHTWLQQRPLKPSIYVFLSYLGDGLSTTAIHKRLMVYRAAAGVTFTAHQLRHTFANDLINADVAVTTIQKLLGHRWLASTQNYVNANDRQVMRDFYRAAETVEGWT